MDRVLGVGVRGLGMGKGVMASVSPPEPSLNWLGYDVTGYDGMRHQAACSCFPKMHQDTVEAALCGMMAALCGRRRVSVWEEAWFCVGGSVALCGRRRDPVWKEACPPYSLPMLQPVSVSQSLELWEAKLVMGVCVCVRAEAGELQLSGV